MRTMWRSLMAMVMAALALPALGQETELIWKDGKWVEMAKPAEGTPEGEAAILRQHLDRGRYAEAVKVAKRMIKRYPGHPLTEEAYGLAGDAELRRGRYWQAYRWYERQIAAFPGGRYLERALEREMEIAKAFLAGKKRLLGGFMPIGAEKTGIEILDRIAQRSIGSERAEVALLTIADHYFDQREWEAACDHYQNFLALFPKSPRAAHAEVRAAESFHRAYRGPLWDETPLVEAQQRYLALRRNRPAKSAELKVDQLLEELRAERAAKQYEIGQFYLRTGSKDAAAFYFALVKKDYGDTRWGKRAGEALQRLGGGSATSGGAKVGPAGKRGPAAGPAGKAGAKGKSK